MHLNEKTAQLSLLCNCIYGSKQFFFIFWPLIFFLICPRTTEQLLAYHWWYAYHTLRNPDLVKFSLPIWNCTPNVLDTFFTVLHALLDLMFIRRRYNSFVDIITYFGGAFKYCPHKKCFELKFQMTMLFFGVAMACTLVGRYQRFG